MVIATNPIINQERSFNSGSEIIAEPGFGGSIEIFERVRGSNSKMSDPMHRFTIQKQDRAAFAQLLLEAK